MFSRFLVAASKPCSERLFCRSRDLRLRSDRLLEGPLCCQVVIHVVVAFWERQKMFVFGAEVLEKDSRKKPRKNPQIFLVI